MSDELWVMVGRCWDDATSRPAAGESVVSIKKLTEIA